MFVAYREDPMIQFSALKLACKLTMSRKQEITGADVFCVEGVLKRRQVCSELQDVPRVFRILKRVKGVFCNQEPTGT